MGGAASRGSKVGAFLCAAVIEPHDEEIEGLRPSHPDVRQDAAERVVVAMRRLGLPEQGEDGSFEAALDDASWLAQRALDLTVKTKMREKYGRGQKYYEKLGPIRTTYIGSFDTIEEFMTPHEAGLRNAWLRAVEDVWTTNCFEMIEADHRSTLRALWDAGDPDVRRAVTLMCEAQRLKALGVSVPNHVRQQLKRLRAKTGLALDCNLL